MNLGIHLDPYFEPILVIALSQGISGMLVGYFQIQLLSPIFRIDYKWVILCTIGFILSDILPIALYLEPNVWLTTIFLYSSLALFQWILLRKKMLLSTWWLVVMGGNGIVIGFINYLIYLASTGIYKMITGTFIYIFIFTALVNLLYGLTSGIVTGVDTGYLLSKSMHKDKIPSKDS